MFFNRKQRISEKYAPVGKIGEGTYGLVYKARNIQNQNPNSKAESFVAVKKFKSFKSGDGISPTAIREIKLLRELKNPYIVDLIDVMLDEVDKALYLVFDYAEHDLLEMIRCHHNRTAPHAMPMHTVKSLLWQILHGINYLHKNWIIHRDLKPSNILVTGLDKPPNERGCVKIADFGLARLFQSPLRPLTEVDAVVVTIWYRAPELLLGAKHYTKAIDLWAIGCIFAELVTSKPLFQGQEKERKGDNRNPFQSDQIDKIFRILGKPTIERWPGVIDLPHWCQAQSWQNYPCILHDRVRGLAKGSSGYDLLTKLLEYDPDKRITAEEALKHPFFAVSTVTLNLQTQNVHMRLFTKRHLFFFSTIIAFVRQEEPQPKHIAFVDPSVDPYKSRPVTPMDPKKDFGWALSATTSGSNGSKPKTRSIPPSTAPLLTSAPPPFKRARVGDR